LRERRALRANADIIPGITTGSSDADPFDDLVESLERAVTPALADPHGHGVPTLQDWQDDHVAICRFVAALLWGDPDQVRT
jgi:hypothetical protein